MLAVELELGSCNFLELGGQSSDLVVVRTALQTGEHSEVDSVLKLLLAEDDAGAGSSQRLVGRGGHDVAVGEGVVHELSGNESTVVSDIGHQESANGVSDLTETREIKITRITRRAGDQKLGLELSNINRQLVVVDEQSLFIHIVVLGFEVDGAGVQLLGLGVVTVGQVTSVGQREAHKFVTRLQQSREDLEIGGTATERLHVDVPLSGVESEGLQGSLLAEGLDLVDVFITAIVPFTDSTFGVFVG